MRSCQRGPEVNVVVLHGDLGIGCSKYAMFAEPIRSLPWERESASSELRHPDSALHLPEFW